MNNRKIFFKGLLAGLLSAAIITLAVFSFKIFIVHEKNSWFQSINNFFSIKNP